MLNLNVIFLDSWVFWVLLTALPLNQVPHHPLCPSPATEYLPSCPWSRPLSEGGGSRGRGGVQRRGAWSWLRGPLGRSPSGPQFVRLSSEGQPVPGAPRPLSPAPSWLCRQVDLRWALGHFLSLFSPFVFSVSSRKCVGRQMCLQVADPKELGMCVLLVEAEVHLRRRRAALGWVQWDHHGVRRGSLPNSLSQICFLAAWRCKPPT